MVFLGMATPHHRKRIVRRLATSSSFFSAGAAAYNSKELREPYGLGLLLFIVHIDELLPNVPESGSGGHDSASSDDNLSSLAIHLALTPCPEYAPVSDEDRLFVNHRIRKDTVILCLMIKRPLDAHHPLFLLSFGKESVSAFQTLQDCCTLPSGSKPREASTHPLPSKSGLFLAFDPFVKDIPNSLKWVV